MSPFSSSQTESTPSLLNRFTSRPALLVFVLCLAVGLGLVGWRAYARKATARTHATDKAMALSAALQMQLNQAVTAAEVLGALANQNGGPIPNFQRVAEELFRARPGLASLELQPGGVVKEIYPRTGHERFLEFDVMKDPHYRVAASATYQRRTVTVSEPLTLYRGDPGIVVRVPVYQRVRDGRDAFYGFVAVSMRLPEAVSRARLDELSTQGYQYQFFFSPAEGQKGISIASRGEVSPDAAKQYFQLQNARFGLALEPRSGWISKSKLALESLVVLFGAGLLCLLVNMIENRSEMESSLADMNRKLTRETADRKQAQEEVREAKEQAAGFETELKQTSATLQQTEQMGKELQTRLESTVRTTNESINDLETRLRETDVRAGELEARLEAVTSEAEESAHARQAELEQTQATLQQTQAALQQAQKTIADLQARLDAAARAEKKAAASAQTRTQQDQATISDLQAQLEAASRSARETAEASAAKLKEAEETNRKLTARLVRAEQAEARVEELTSLVEKTQADLEKRQADLEKAQAELETRQATVEIPESTPEKQVAETAPDTWEPEHEAVIEHEAAAEPEVQVVESVPAEEEPTFSVEEPAATKPTETPAPDLEENSWPDDLQPTTPEPVAPVATDAEPEPANPVATNSEPEPAAPAVMAPEPEPLPATPEEQLMAATPVPVPEAPAPAPEMAPQPAKPARRKKAPRDVQMDFFGGGQPAPTPTAKEAEVPALPGMENGKAAAEEQDKAAEERAARVRRLPSPPPFNLSEFRKAVNDIVPLLSGEDPGAKDCLKDNRDTFRSGFSPEAYAEFEHSVKASQFPDAVEHLRKAAKKHGVPA